MEDTNAVANSNAFAALGLAKDVTYTGSVVAKLRDNSGSVHSLLVEVAPGKVGRLPKSELNGTADQQESRRLFKGDSLYVRVTRPNPAKGRFELSERAVPRFVYSSYWGTWSRLLSDGHPLGPYVEVNLTPINGWDSEDGLKRITPIRIRTHCTTRSAKDECVLELPANIKALMVEHLGAALTERLLAEDFLSQIDWDLYRKHCNGGANLEDIRRVAQ